MATSYTGLRVQDTYNAIIKIGDNSNLTATPKLLSDGLGNDSPLYLSGTRLGIGISPAYQFHTSGNAKIGGDVIISGDLTVNGDLTYLNVTDLAVEDPLIKLAKDNAANTLDIGLFGKYVATGTKYKGFFNDASDDKFKLFIGTTVEPTTTVDTSATGYTVGTLVANLEGNADTSTGVLITADNTDTSRRMVFTESNNTTDTDGRLFKDSASNFYYNPSSNRLTLVNLTGTTGTFSGLLKADTLELTSGSDHLTITESSGDWTINNSQQNNGIKIYDGTGGIDLIYNSNAKFTVDSAGVKVNSNYNFAVDTDTLYVDSTNEIVGINSTGNTDYKLYVNGKIATNNYVIAGLGNGGVAFTHNDGYGNANVTFNHVSGTPEQDGSSGRIVVTTDGTTAKMTFELKDDVTSGVAVDTPQIMELYSSSVVSNVQTKVRATAGGILSLQRNDTSIIDGNPLGRLVFSGDDPTDGTFNSGAEIRGEAAGTWSTNNYPSELQFYTKTTDTDELALKLDSSQNAEFRGDILISKDDPKLTFLDSTVNTDPSGQILFSELSGHRNFDINYNGTDDRLEFRGKVGETEDTDLMYINRDSTDTVQIIGGLRVNGTIKDSSGDAGTSGQLLSSTGTGTNWIDFEADTAKRLEVDVKNVHGATLAKGTVVHAEPTGTLSGNVIEVVAADANTKMPAIGILNEALLDDGEGKAVMFGTVQGIDTSAFSVGDELYVSATAGEFTATKPTATTEEVQKIAIVVKSSANNGLIKVFGAGRANDVPNLLTRDITIDGADFYFGNADQIRMGDSIGLRIQHNGSNSFIDGEIGNMYFRAEANDSDMIFQADDGSGSNTEYFRLDGGLATHDGTNTTQTVTVFPDNSKIQLGDDAAGAFRLFHNGTNSFIANNTGNIEIINYSDEKDIIFKSDNGSGDVIEYFRLDGSTNTIPFGRSPHLPDSLKLYFGSSTADDGSIRWDSTASELFIDGDSKFLEKLTANNNFVAKGTVNLNVMSGHQSEGSIQIGRYDANTSRYHLIKNYVSSTQASNYIKFSLHNGTENSTTDVLSLFGDGDINVLGDVDAGSLTSRNTLAVTGISTFTSRVDMTGTSGWSSPSYFYSAYANTTGMRMVGNESQIDLVSQDLGEHASSILLRGANQGFGLTNSITNNRLELKYFVADDDGFSIHGSGTNVSTLTNVVFFNSNGTVDFKDDVDVDGNLTVDGSTTSGNITVSQSGTPQVILNDTGNAGGGGASGKIIFKNTAGNAIGLGYTGDNTATSNLIISTDAGSTYGGYLGLDAAAAADPSNIILDPKTNVISTKPVRSYNVFIADDIDVTNATPATDELRASGYGIIGSRGLFYITNAQSGGSVQIGNGTSHNADPTALFSGSTITHKRDTVIEGDLTLTKAQITTNIGTTSHLYISPDATTNTTGKTSMFLGTSTVDNYGISLRGARLGTDGTPTFELAVHNNSANGSVALEIDQFLGTHIKGELFIDDVDNIASTAQADKFLVMDTGDSEVRYATSSQLASAINANTGVGGAGLIPIYETSNTFTTNSNLYWDIANGRLGLGDTTPSYRLDLVTGTIDTAQYSMRISHSRNNPDQNSAALFVRGVYSGTKSDATDIVQRGLHVDVDSSATGTASDEHRLYGIHSDTRNSGFADQVYGTYSLAESNYTGAKTQYVGGVYGLATHDANSASGGVTNLFGVKGLAQVQDDGDVDVAMGGQFNVAISNNRDANVDQTIGVWSEIQIDEESALTYGTMYGYRSIIDNNELDVPTFGNQYLFHGDYQGNRGSNAWGIYCDGDKHYFEGKVGIGEDAAATLLSLKGTKNESIITLKSTTNDSNWTSGDIIGGINFYSEDGSSAGAGIKGSISYIATSNTGGSTGISFKTSDSSSNNVQRMFINNIGVGIGTQSPAHDLDIESTNPTLILTQSGAVNQANSGRILFAEAPAYSSGHFEIKYDGSANRLRFNSPLDGTTNLMNIGRDGFIGIDITTPVYKLDIRNAGSNGINISGTGAYLRWNSGDMQIRNDGSYAMAFDTWTGSALTEKMLIDSAGNIIIAGQTVNHIKTDTSDGSDNKGMIINSAGGPGSSSRGAYISMYGNEHASLAGDMYITAGNTSNAELRLHAVHSGGVVTTYAGGSLRHTVSSTETTIANYLEVTNTIATENGMGTAGEWDAARIRVEATNTIDNTGFSGIRFATSTANNYGWSMGSNRVSNGLGDFRIYEHQGASTGFHRITIQKTTGYLGVKDSTPSYHIDVNGTIRATGDVIAYSDRRVKDNIETIENGLEKVTKLRGVSYTRNDIEDDTTKIGVIAQEVLEVLPEVVKQDDKGKYSVSYGNMAGLFIEAIKDLKAEINELKAEINELKSK